MKHRLITTYIQKKKKREIFEHIHIHIQSSRWIGASKLLEPD